MQPPCQLPNSVRLEAFQAALQACAELCRQPLGMRPIARIVALADKSELLELPAASSSEASANIPVSHELLCQDLAKGSTVLGIDGQTGKLLAHLDSTALAENAPEWSEVQLLRGSVAAHQAAGSLALHLSENNAGVVLLVCQVGEVKLFVSTKVFAWSEQSKWIQLHPQTQRNFLSATSAFSPDIPGTGFHMQVDVNPVLGARMTMETASEEPEFARILVLVLAAPGGLDEDLLQKRYLLRRCGHSARIEFAASPTEAEELVRRWQPSIIHVEALATSADMACWAGEAAHMWQCVTPTNVAVLCSQCRQGFRTGCADLV